MSPASGDGEYDEREYDYSEDIVSIQLMSPASGDPIYQAISYREELFPFN